jgi:hypothetical protein
MWITEVVAGAVAVEQRRLTDLGNAPVTNIGWRGQRRRHDVPTC